MADIGALALKISCDPSSFEAGLLKAEATAKKFDAQIKNTGTNVLATFNAIRAHPLAYLAFALGEGVKQLVAMEHEGSAAINTQAQLSRKFGLTAEAAGGLSLAAKQLGVDQDDLSKSMLAYEVQLGKAARGSPEAAAAFNRLGFRAEELIKLPLDQQLGSIGDALAKLPAGTERTGAAYDVLTRRGAQLLPVLLQGSKGIEKNIELSKQLGLTVSAADAEAVRKALVAERQAHVALASLRQSLANEIAIAWAPFREANAERTIEAAHSLRDALKEVIGFAAKVGEGLGKIYDIGVAIDKRVHPLNHVYTDADAARDYAAYRKDLDERWAKEHLEPLVPIDPLAKHHHEVKAPEALAYNSREALETISRTQNPGLYEDSARQTAHHTKQTAHEVKKLRESLDKGDKKKPVTIN